MCRTVIWCALLLTALPMPVRAQSPDPVTALLEACTTPKIGLALRFQMLDAANWRTAADSQLVRELSALTALARVPDAFRGVSEAKISDLQQAATEPFLIALPPGQPLSLDSFENPTGPDPFLNAAIVHRDLPALARVRIQGQATRLVLECVISLSEPLAVPARAALLQRRQPLDAIPPAQLDKAETFHMHFRPKTHSDPDDSLKLLFHDIGRNSALYLLAGQAGYDMRLATQLTTVVAFFPLEVTP